MPEQIQIKIRTGIFHLLFLCLFLLSAYKAFAGNTGLLFDISATGTPANVNLTLCGNGKAPVSCQHYHVKALNLTICPVVNFPYPFVGIRVNSSGYELGSLNVDCKPFVSGYCLFPTSQKNCRQISLIDSEPLTINPPTLPAGKLNIAYSATLTASGGLGPYAFAVTSGALPPGLTLSSGGEITGTPTSPGTYPFSILATDTNSGHTGSRSYSISIGPFLYSATLNNGTIGQYNVNTGAAINASLISSSSSLFGFTIDEAGNLYTANYSQGSIGKYNASTGAAINTSFITGLTLPTSIVIDGAGNLYVANNGGDSIGKYNASTGDVIDASFITGLSTPYTIAIDGTGALYVTNFFGSNSIGKYNASTGAVIDAAFITGVKSPSGIVIDAAGNLYVASQFDSNIGKFNASTGAAINTSFITGLNFPSGIVIDDAGNLYVANQTGGTIGKYNSSTGAAINPSFITGLDSPTGLVLY